MANKIKLSGQTVRRLKNDLSDCDAIRQDLERAIKAGVPQCDVIADKLAVIEERINKLLMLNGEVPE